MVRGYGVGADREGERGETVQGGRRVTAATAASPAALFRWTGRDEEEVERGGEDESEGVM